MADATAPQVPPPRPLEADSDEDEDYEEPSVGTAFRLHDLAEQGAVDRLRALLPLKDGEQTAAALEAADGGALASRRHVMATESGLLEKDDMGCLPIHVAAIHQQLPCLLHLLRYSEALTSAMLRLKCGEFGTPFVHLVLRVGAINRGFCDAVVADLFGADSDASNTGAAFSDDFRALLLEKLGARDEEGSNAFHLCAVNDLEDSLRVLTAFFLRCHAAEDDKGRTALQTLLEKPNKVGFRPIHLAMKFGSARVASALIQEHAVNVNVRASLQQTPAHVAALAGFQAGVAMLLKSGRADLALADMWGHTAAQIAAKCKFSAIEAMLRASDGVEDAPMADSAHQTRFLFHDETFQHLPMSRHRRGGPELPAENPERVATLIDERYGILHSREFKADHIVWDSAVERADIADVLRVHEFNYVDKLRQRCDELRADQPPPQSIESGEVDESATFAWDYDTALSLQSHDAAFRAAGAVCKAVDDVVDGTSTNAFCIVRPPGHHAGPVGKVVCENDPEGSLGFCLLNNVAVGAAYARAHYKRRGIHKVAILDMDVHHGNGTEEIVRQLTPSTRTCTFETPYGTGSQVVHAYKPWRDDRDSENVFFCSVHGYGHKEEDGVQHEAWFYPGSGESKPDATAPLILNVGLGVNHDGGSASASVSRLKWRSALRDRVLPALHTFNPDLIFLSAGFDAHKKERVNWGYISLLEQDYEWLVQHVKRIANSCCDGRLISVLEGGYNYYGRMVSPLARSVAAHARALTSPARDEWDERDVAKESAHERALLQNYVSVSATVSRVGSNNSSGGAVQVPVVKKRRPVAAEQGQSVDAPPTRVRSKRSRKVVDYVALAKELAAEQRDVHAKPASS
jgi:acetoin utilization deacetylase AcuC-like enzyme/ankyrin repeat protein